MKDTYSPINHKTTDKTYCTVWPMGKSTVDIYTVTSLGLKKQTETDPRKWRVVGSRGHQYIMCRVVAAAVVGQQF